MQVCVVGGGLAGLAAAYRLRDTDLLLLEHLKSTGGHCARGRWKDVYYCECAAYFVEPEPPLDAFYDEMKFPIRKMAEPSDSAILAGKYVLDTFGTGVNKLPVADAARRDFARMRREMEALLESDDYPNMPIGEATAEARKLDRMTWADWLLKDRGFHPDVKIFVDLYCPALGAPSAEHLSAFAGLNCWASEFMPRYTFPGGLAFRWGAVQASLDAPWASGAPLEALTPATLSLSASPARRSAPSRTRRPSPQLVPFSAGSRSSAKAPKPQSDSPPRPPCRSGWPLRSPPKRAP